MEGKGEGGAPSARGAQGPLNTLRRLWLHHNISKTEQINKSFTQQKKELLETITLSTMTYTL